jgi:C4-dicarboxylate-specific signal transduction histidine kinase
MKRRQKTRAGAKASRHHAPTRSELQDELTEVNRHRAAISEVLRAIANSPYDLQPTFDTIVDSATRLCRADTGSLRLYEEKGFRLLSYRARRPVAQKYSPPELLALDGFYAQLVASRSPVHVPNLAAHELYRPAVDTHVVATVDAGYRTILIVPLVKDEALFGALAVGRTTVRPFTNKQIELVTDFAAQATIALEITSQERQLREVQTELARANRIATIGEMSSSIVHEVNQPITGLIANSEAALEWLSHGPAKLAEARTAIECAITDGKRAAEIVGRIRDLINKAPPKKDRFDMNEAIRDVIVLTRGEAVKNGVSVQVQFADGLPLIEGDRVQLQQVILNLIVNAIQAMSGIDAKRDLHLSTVNVASEGTLVAVRDSGSGLRNDHLSRLFEPFYTTKPDGLGMGLPICRSIIEAHGGRLWATPNEPRGAVFQFTLPPGQTN